MEVEPARGDPRARPERLLLANGAPNLVQARLTQAHAVERQRPDQHFIEQDAERIDVAARVHVDGRQLCLLGAHVLGRAEKAPELGEQGPLGQRLRDRLRDAEVDDARDGMVVSDRDQHIGRLQVAVNDALLVRMLDAVAELDEQLEALAESAGADGRSNS